MIDALRHGHHYATNGPELLDIAIDGDALEVRCSPARWIVMASRYETGWGVRADVRSRQEDAEDPRARRSRARRACPVRAADGTAVPADRDRGRTRTQGMVEPDLSADLAFAHELADAAAEVTMSWFGAPAAGRAEGRRDTGDRGRPPGGAGDPRRDRGPPPGRRRAGRGSRPAARARTDAGG